MIEIPLNSSPEQIFSIVLNEEKYDIRVLLNSRANDGKGLWSLSLEKDSVVLISGIAMLGGADILGAYNLDIKNVFVVNLDESNVDPTKENLGTGARLFVLSEEEMLNV